jgi:hypothetical protein
MTSRRERFASVETVTVLETRTETLDQKSSQLPSRTPPEAMSIATNAPYGLTVQGDLVCESITATTTAGALTVPRMTTTQRNALTAAVGMIIYNTTDSKFQGYAGSSWVNLH